MLQQSKPSNPSQHVLERDCDELADALSNGNLGDIVAKHEKLIMHYYTDVREQAKQSFDTAKAHAQIGLCVLEQIPVMFKHSRRDVGSSCILVA